MDQTTSTAGNSRNRCKATITGLCMGVLLAFSAVPSSALAQGYLRLPPPQEVPQRLSAGSVPPLRQDSPQAHNEEPLRLPSPESAPAQQPQAGLSLQTTSTSRAERLADYLGSDTARISPQRAREAASFRSGTDIVERLIAHQNGTLKNETPPAREVTVAPGSTQPLAVTNGMAPPPRSRWGQLPVYHPAAAPEESATTDAVPEPAAASAIALSYPAREGGNVLAGTDKKALRLQSNPQPAAVPVEPATDPEPTRIPRAPIVALPVNSPDIVANSVSPQRGFPYAFFAETDALPVTLDSTETRVPVEPLLSAPAIASTPKPLAQPARAIAALPAPVESVAQPERATQALARVLNEKEELHALVSGQTVEEDVVQKQTNLPDLRARLQKPNAPAISAPENTRIILAAPSQEPRLPAPLSSEPEQTVIAAEKISAPLPVARPIVEDEMIGPEPLPTRTSENIPDAESTPKSETQASLRDQLLQRTQRAVQVAVADAARSARGE